MKVTILFFCSFCLFCLPWCIPGSLLNSVTWEINQDGTGDFTIIQEGINASADTDTVLVYPGTYFENLDFNGHNITLASLELTTGNEQYIDSTKIDGQNEESCIRIQNGETDARVQGFTIKNGYGTHFWANDGGGFLIHDYSTAYITNCIIKDNTASLGAGIYARHGILHLSGLKIINNSAGYGGALYMGDDSTVSFDSDNLCSIYNNNAGKGTDIFIQDTGQVNVVVDTFSVFEPSRYFAEYIEGSTYTFEIQNNWMELEPNNLYVAVDGDNANSGLTPDEPLKTISWAVRKIQADEQNPRTVHVAAGVYSYAINEQLFPIGCKEYVSIIGVDVENTILISDFVTYNRAIVSFNLNGFVGLENFQLRSSNNIYSKALLSLRLTDNIYIKNIKISDNINNESIAHFYQTNVDINNMIISNNNSDFESGLYLGQVGGSMRNCIITNNTTNNAYSEAAIYLYAWDDFHIENCEISNNNANNTNATIIRTADITADDFDLTMVNCLISDNNSSSDRIFYVLGDGSNEITNCTFVNNSSNNTTIKACGDITLTNTIMHNNTNYEILMENETGIGNIFDLNLQNCNINNGEVGVYNQGNANNINWLESNIEDDPLFAGIGDYQLTYGSPCVDAGTPDTLGLYLPPWDLLNNYRLWDGDENGSEIIDMGCYEFGADEYIVGITNDELPFTNYKLQNYPNPFNPETKIIFELPEAGDVKLEIFNVKGQKIKTLINCYMSQGGGELIWNGKDENNKRVTSGVYFYQLKTPSKTITKKCILLK